MTWIRKESLEQLTPITQVYGICFNEHGEILICRETADGKWQLPGGKPEGNETPEQTLLRELIEETNAMVKNAKVLGVQKVDFPNNPNLNEGNEFYQARMICELDELLPPSPDPASGRVWERQFVPADQIKDYIKWGAVGDAMFDDAIKLWKDSHPNTTPHS